MPLLPIRKEAIVETMDSKNKTHEAFNKHRYSAFSRGTINLIKVREIASPALDSGERSPICVNSLNY
jgi:hypothetical protein